MEFGIELGSFRVTFSVDEKKLESGTELGTHAH